MTEHPTLAAALVAALADCSVVDKGRTANAGSYSYEYADLGDVVKKTRPALAEHGVVALTPVVDNGSNLQVTVVLLHSSGEKLEFGPFSFPHGKDAQATGSMVTYHRRYALVSALGMAAGDDDDGATARPRQEQPDEVQCSRCGDVIQGARSSREPMRAHLVETHGWVRQDDGSVVAPKTDDETSGAENVGGGDQPTVPEAPADTPTLEPEVLSPDALAMAARAARRAQAEQERDAS